MLDKHPLAWKFPFFIGLALSLAAMFIQAALIDNDQIVQKGGGLKIQLFNPLKDSVHLMIKNQEFRRFQWAFMIGGIGLMIIQPVIPIYFTQRLLVSYSDLMIAFSICKALGFVLTTPLWSGFLKSFSQRAFVGLVLLGFALFSFLLLFSSMTLYSLFFAYFIYGVAQAGSHLIWHLSALLFSENEPSSRYLGINTVMVGIRGLIGPMIGWFLMHTLSPPLIFTMSMAFSLMGAIYYFPFKIGKTTVVP
jgi:MFS family permease